MKTSITLQAYYSNYLCPGKRGAHSYLQAHRGPMRFGAPVRARRPASPHPPLSRGMITCRPSLLIHISFSFFLASAILLTPAAGSGLRPPLITDHRRSSIAVLRLYMRHRHLQSRVSTGLRSLDRFSLALPSHSPSPLKSSSGYQNRPLSLSHTDTLRTLLAVSGLLASARPNRRWFVLGVS